MARNLRPLVGYFFNILTWNGNIVIWKIVVTRTLVQGQEVYLPSLALEYGWNPMLQFRTTNRDHTFPHSPSNNIDTVTSHKTH